MGLIGLYPYFFVNTFKLRSRVLQGGRNKLSFKLSFVAQAEPPASTVLYSRPRKAARDKREHPLDIQDARHYRFLVGLLYWISKA